MEAGKANQWITELAITVVFFIPGSFIFPFVAWITIAILFHKLEMLTGYKAPLVGEPDEVSFGAVLVVLIYLMSCVSISILCFKNKWFFCAAAIGAGSLFFSFYIFRAVTLLIWS